MNFLPLSIRAIVRNSFSTVIVRGTFGFARIIVFMILAKTYGATYFGLYSLILIIIEIAKVFSDLGVDIVSIRRFAADSQNIHSILESILGLKLLAAAFGALMAMSLYAIFYRDSYGLVLLAIGCISIFTTLPLNAFVSYYQTQLSMEKIINAHLIGYGCYLSFSILAIMFKLSLFILIGIIPLSEGIILFLLLRRYQIQTPIRIKFNIPFIRKLLSESIYVGIAGLAVVIYLRLDNIMISRLLDLKSVGQYAFAYRLTEPFSLLFTSFGISLYASLSALSIDTKVYERFSHAKNTLIGMLIIACVGILIYIFIVRPLLPSFSVEYMRSGDVLLVLSFVLFFKALNTQLTAILNSMEKFRIVSGITFFNLVTSIVLNYFFILHYGIIGAAMAVVGTELVNSLLQASSLLFYHQINK
ncbi:MAG: oligosaccharide flippase family protein [Bacteroidota bacterium]|jgi:O-antigen/teichoic acid export membrane protein